MPESRAPGHLLGPKVVEGQGLRSGSKRKFSLSVPSIGCDSQALEEQGEAEGGVLPLRLPGYLAHLFWVTALTTQTGARDFPCLPGRGIPLFYCRKACSKVEKGCHCKVVVNKG